MLLPNASWVNFKDWVCLFCCDDSEIIFLESLRTAFLKVKEIVTDHRKHQQMPDIEIFLNDFLLNQSIDMRKEIMTVLGVSDSQHIIVKEKTKMITILLDRLDESEVRIGWLIDRLNEEEDGKIFAEGNAEKLKIDFNDAANDLKVREGELKDLVGKIGALNAKNVNWKIKRIRQK